MTSPFPRGIRSRSGTVSLECLQVMLEYTLASLGHLLLGAAILSDLESALPREDFQKVKRLLDASRETEKACDLKILIRQKDRLIETLKEIIKAHEKKAVSRAEERANKLSEELAQARRDMVSWRETFRRLHPRVLRLEERVEAAIRARRDRSESAREQWLERRKDSPAARRYFSAPPLFGKGWKHLSNKAW